jgi:DtxR family Mn-dependent transcriptional regulator
MAAQIAIESDLAGALTPGPSLGAVRLSQIAADQPAVVDRIDGESNEPLRLRMLDLGLTRGARIERQLDGPFGGVSAYRVRGTLIALRDQQADLIWVRPTRN